MPTAHKCPVSGCHILVPRDRAMCPIHWRQVPKPIQVAVWRTYKLAPGSRAHFAAITAAVRSVNPTQPWKSESIE